uniref:Uncharacterized protein n=1 Tax=Anguilla anguilla TaxID=7936 RepID=A0A0E9QCZ4_ANGAN
MVKKLRVSDFRAWGSQRDVFKNIYFVELIIY